MYKYIALLFIAVFCVGCTTTSVYKMGTRRENKGVYQFVELADDKLWVGYKSMAYKRSINNDYLNKDRNIWGSVRLTELNWSPYKGPYDYGVNTSGLHMDCSGTDHSSEKRTTVNLIKIETYEITGLLTELPQESPITAYTESYSDLLLLARRRDGLIEAVRLQREPGECDYHEPWVPYARIVLTPFAVVLDIVTSPIQALYFIGMAGYSE